MSRTMGGYLFRCKECGNNHLYAFKPHKGIRLPCAKNKHRVHKYNKKDFTPWWGSYWDVCNNIIDEEVKD